MDEDPRRTRISLGLPSFPEKGNASAPRKRAVSIAGTRVISPRSLARRSMAPRKSILKQHVSLPAVDDETQTFELPLSDAPSTLRSSRQSEGGRRVSFAANAQVRLFDKLQGSPSPAKISTPNRASFRSDGDPNISPLKRRGMSLPRRRSSLLSQGTPDHNLDTEEGSTSAVSRLSVQPDDENSDMDIDEDGEHGDGGRFSPKVHGPAFPNMPVVGDEVPAPLSLPAVGPLLIEPASPGGGINSPRVSNTSDMSIAIMPSDLSPETQKILLDADHSDMSIALTAKGGPSRRESIVSDMDVTNMDGLVPTVEEHPAHEFVVPLGRSIPRTDRDGNVVSPTPAEKAKAAALASLQQLSAASGDSPSEDGDEDEGPVVPIRATSDMSIEDATRRLRAASQDFELSADDQTGSTSSNDMSLVTGEPTVNITTMPRSSSLHGQTKDDAPDNPAVDKPSMIPVPSAKFPTPSSSKIISTISPVKPRSAFRAAFTPPFISPRKRALSAPSPSPSPAKRRGLIPPVGAPPKRERAQSVNPFQSSPLKVSQFTRNRAPLKKGLSFTASLSRNPFLEEAPHTISGNSSSATTTSVVDQNNVHQTVPGSLQQSDLPTPGNIAHRADSPKHTSSTSKLQSPVSPYTTTEEAMTRIGDEQLSQSVKDHSGASLVEQTNNTPVDKPIKPSAPPIGVRKSFTPFPPINRSRRLSTVLKGRLSNVIEAPLPEPTASKAPEVSTHSIPAPSEDMTSIVQSDDGTVPATGIDSKGLPGVEARRRRSELRRSIAARLSLSKAPETSESPALKAKAITRTPTTANMLAEAANSPLHIPSMKPRSTFGRASFVPAPRPSLVPQLQSQKAESRPTPATMSLADFVRDTGNEFKDITVDPPVPRLDVSQYPEGSEGYSLADTIQAMTIHYPQIDFYEDSISEMKRQIEILEDSCQQMYMHAERHTPEVILDWLEADDDTREMIKTALKIRRTNASLKADEAWISWKAQNTQQMLDSAKVHLEDLEQLRVKLDEIDNQLPTTITALQLEYDQLQAELEQEQAMIKELEECDPQLLEDVNQELHLQNIELEEVQASVRQSTAQLEVLLAKEREVQAEVNGAREAIEHANARADQIRGDTREEAARLKGVFTMLQDLHGWHLMKVQTDLLLFQYDAQAARFLVQLQCRGLQVHEVDISLLPNGPCQTEDTIINELMLDRGKTQIAQTNLPKNPEQVRSRFVT
ncbi:Spc7 kinetochore protein-domain-containing protein [Cantharellus anzutake]|uniref:Spc7 kinetochore protein-domain-containing protein n=1 Tax=Cantharellus anzutake TaxID=1750568 RepID=UPI0019038AA6|nr:Spc7 kinetochore protein-domain-containing protein [Cantharellus anzutake]KAF8342836.1 Spc7 kinetochore protein-domain-containing protein [Cantharellus anzutake]